MESLKYLYRIGPGPSSSHTIGPSLAAKYFKNKYPEADFYKVTLFGSLALTGKGHLTDYIIIHEFEPIKCEVIFNNSFLPKHPNGMAFDAYKDNNKIGEATIYSIGGGSLDIENEKKVKPVNVYPEDCFEEIKEFLKNNKRNLVEYVKYYEPKIDKYLGEAFDTMCSCIERGLTKDGNLPGELKLKRVAKEINKEANKISAAAQDEHKRIMLITSYAYAVAEENASGGEIVCAPTCGSAGVFPAVLYYFYHDLNVSKKKIIEAMMVGGVFGNVIKQNATISGAQGGCQAEVGTACSMAAAGVAHLLGLGLDRIEYASEVAMEHHLGLTCDPVLGYVQIPCIERNGVAALRAYDAALYGKYIANHRSNVMMFDDVVNVMKKTGLQMNEELRETAIGGLAEEYTRREKFKRWWKEKRRKNESNY